MVAISKMIMCGPWLPYHMTILDHGCHIADGHVWTMVAISQMTMSGPWLPYHR
ncbi:hypothetical protein DPMN_075191 [Dreissena polymorpha]|uniref:Uncharacterized protein n=1 Tax=Dreissena polymorpha TaxID=45954 RepID=A0A9D3YJW0_DREPO|nr:hypothetical protein DPMN_075191 [Dreissena polymorpha]